jgi:hypothetical protein
MPSRLRPTRKWRGLPVTRPIAPGPAMAMRVAAMGTPKLLRSLRATGRRCSEMVCADQVERGQRGVKPRTRLIHGQQHWRLA